MEDKKPNSIKMFQRCGTCHGTGETTQPIEGDVICPSCEGEGYTEVFQIDFNDVRDKLNDIMNKCNDIFEKVNV